MREEQDVLAAGGEGGGGGLPAYEAGFTGGFTVAGDVAAKGIVYDEELGGAAGDEAERSRILDFGFQQAHSEVGAVIAEVGYNGGGGVGEAAERLAEASISQRPAHFVGFTMTIPSVVHIPTVFVSAVTS